MLDMKKYYLFLLLVCSSILAMSQIATEPAFPIASQQVKITFDSKLDGKLGPFSQDLYAHTGVGIEGVANWQHVIGTWGQNNVQPKLTFIGNGVYELLITPDISTFYSVSSGEKVINMSFVFRNAAGNKQTNDLFITVYQSGLNIELQFPTANAILEKGTPYTFSAISSSSASLKMYLDNTLVESANGETINAPFQFDEQGEHKVLITAENNEGQIAKDSTYICIRGNQITEALPSGAKKGISYPDNQSARLVLFAPGKSYVFVLGDFNDWKPMNSYQMKKDGDYFWFDLTDLKSNKEYIFQYYIDSKIRIADPYTEKISDSWNDSAIDTSTYPGLISYPKGKSEGIASVLQPGQQPYQWGINNFEIPQNTQLVIYEMLIRDFTEEHTYQAVIDKLDYLSDLHINVLELMPVNEFEGNNSWGYNPSFYFAPDKYYGPKNDLKKLIDECHNRGIAVVIDMVLNHSYGQSPLVRMYWDEANGRPAADNPWYNTASPNQTYSWGYDFNHESKYTKELVDSVNSFWMKEYNVDGFRFDFTKGFTNKSGDGWAKDQSRIDILERMADEIWKRKPGALVICEHLSDNTEEKVLAEHGLMLWGNLNNNYCEAAMGYNENGKSDLTQGVYKSRSWTNPNLVTYQESHDEERVAYKCLTYGSAFGDYDTKQLATALNRMKLNSLFHVPLPGPKMIWQFGELGYDYSINTCVDGTVNNCRLDMKPIRWDYKNQPDRSALFQVVASLNYLKLNYEEFSAPTNFTYSLSGAQKNYHLTFGTNYVVAVGNFAMDEKTVNVTFQVAGTWYDYFGKSTIEVAGSNMDITLKPGEYRLFSTREFQHPEFTTTGRVDLKNTSDFTLFPNPVTNKLTVNYKDIVRIDVYNLNGQKVRIFLLNPTDEQQVLDVNFLDPGMYILKGITSNNFVLTGKFIKD
jgi:1,4-alpha-glucan branching enzyme